MAEVVCLGELLIDFVPLRPGVYRQAAGGAPANVAVGLARLGVSAAFISKVGDDAFGRFLRAALEDEGVDTSGLVAGFGGGQTCGRPPRPRTAIPAAFS